MFKRVIASLVIVCFSTTFIQPLAGAQSVNLPAPGTMVNLSPAYEPALIKGLTVHKDNPFLFDFIVDTGDSQLTTNDQRLKTEGDRLIKYFFACLTIPEKDLWVNLSPYEKNRMIPQALGQTALGRDLLAQDYILKQLTASLIYPEKDLGKKFWDMVYTKAWQIYGTSQVPAVGTFNKVWVLADKATVYEHGQTAFVVGGHLKVMLEEDYVALQRSAESRAESRDLALSRHDTPTHSLASQIVREVILPEIEKEVNTGKNFSMLRQIFNSQILATWYKKNLKEALLNQVYADKGKIKGVEAQNFASLQPKDIYQMYLKAYKKGVFNYIKEESNPTKGGETIPRKYFSGGYGSQLDKALVVSHDPVLARSAATPIGTDFAMQVAVGINRAPIQRSDAAMTINFTDSGERRMQQFGKFASMWLDFISGEDLENGQIQAAIDAHVVGMTSNPAIFAKAIAESKFYDGRIKALAARGLSQKQIYETLAIADIQSAADKLLPVYKTTNGKDGFISLEIDPNLADDANASIEEGIRLWKSVNRPNLMIKVPVTEKDAGYEVITALLARGINVNVTLLFSPEQYKKQAQAVLEGLKQLAERRYEFVPGGHDITKVRSVASFFVSRVDTAVDQIIDRLVASGHTNLQSLRGKAGIGNSIIAYGQYKKIFSSSQWKELAKLGAVKQRVLWASTGVKDKKYSPTMYVTNLIADESTVNTAPPDTIQAFVDSSDPIQPVLTGSAEQIAEAAHVMAQLEAAGINMNQVFLDLTADGKKKFVGPFTQLMAAIKQKSDAAMTVNVKAPQDFKPMALKVNSEKHREVGTIIPGGFGIGEIPLDLNDSKTRNQLRTLIKLASFDGIIFKEAKLLFASDGSNIMGMGFGLFNDRPLPVGIILLNSNDWLVSEYGMLMVLRHVPVIYPFCPMVNLTGIRSEINGVNKTVIINPDAAMTTFLERLTPEELTAERHRLAGWKKQLEESMSQPGANKDTITAALNDVKVSLEQVNQLTKDHAQTALPPGGIDLNAANMGLSVTKDANGGVKVNFDPAMIERIKQEGVQSVVPVIINVIPMSPAQIRPLLGMSASASHRRDGPPVKEEERLAGV